MRVSLPEYRTVKKRRFMLKHFVNIVILKGAIQINVIIIQLSLEKSLYVCLSFDFWRPPFIISTSHLAAVLLRRTQGRPVLSSLEEWFSRKLQATIGTDRPLVHCRGPQEVQWPREKFFGCAILEEAAIPEATQLVRFEQARFERERAHDMTCYH